MTDNVINFPKREPAPKTDRTPELTDQKVVPNLVGKTLAEIIKSLRVSHPYLYFDPHLIVNDNVVLKNLQIVVEQVLKLGQQANPPPSGPITDHKS